MNELVPSEFYLGPNYPNPFNEKTTIKYCVAYKTRVQVSIFTTEGAVIKILVDAIKSPGTYEVEFIPEECSSDLVRSFAQGYYYYQMIAGDYVSEKRWLCINKLSGRLNMKAFIQTLFFFFLVTQICFGQWWTIENLPDSNLYLTDVQFINSDTGFVVGYAWNTNTGVILKTYDQTATFFSTYFETGVIFKAIQFIDKSNGWAVGDSGIIYHTTDCGNNWIKQNSGTKESFSSLSFIDQLNGWTSTDSIIYRTTNGGINWIPQSILPEWITQVFFVDQHFGWCSINGGVGKSLNGRGWIMRTTDGGETWTGLPNKNIDALYFINENNGWAIGDAGKFLTTEAIILKTTDGGSNWIVKDSLNGIWLNDIYFYNNNIGWSVGSMGTILKSTDGGENWIIQDSGTGSSDILNSVNFINQNEGWITGFDLLLYTYNGGGVSFVEEEQTEEIPTVFLLSNNYPNPFNPSTKIKYSVPQSSQVQIKVFDVLGNEIETLVNEEKPVGTYEVTWYAEQLPSGVYFYQLKAGEYVEVKKMLLLK